MKRFRGIVPVLITPMNEHGQVDKEGLANLTRYYIDKKVSGLWVLGTGGEDMGLTFSQRVSVAETVADVAKGKLKLAVGTSFYSVDDSLNFMVETKSLDFDCYHAMPFNPKVSSKQIISWYQLLADRAEKPFWAYTSGNWAQNITPHMIETIKSHANIEGVKFSTSNAVDLQHVSYLNDSSFQVISAVIKTYYYSLCLGLEAATSVEATLFIDEIREVEAAFFNGDLNLARKKQKALLRCLSYPSPSAEDNFLRVAELKHLISKIVNIHPCMSLYYRNLTPQEKESLDHWYAVNYRK